MSVLATLFRVRVFSAVLALLAAGGAEFLDQFGSPAHHFSLGHLGAAYVGLDALFTFLAIVFYWRAGPRFIALYALLTLVWLTVAFLLLVFLI